MSSGFKCAPYYSRDHSYLARDAEPQNHKRLRLEVASEGYLIQSLLRQGHLGPVTQDHVQRASEYCQGWRLHNQAA